VDGRHGGKPEAVADLLEARRVALLPTNSRTKFEDPLLLLRERACDQGIVNEAKVNPFGKVVLVHLLPGANRGRALALAALGNFIPRRISLPRATAARLRVPGGPRRSRSANVTGKER
jgi:hypothetical protein